MPYLEVLFEIAPQFCVLFLVGVVYLEKFQLGSVLEFDLVVPRSVIWQPCEVFCRERRVSLVVVGYLPRYRALRCTFVVRELAP